MDNLDKTVSNKKLKHAAEEWRATFDAIKDMISIHDKDYNILRANKAFSAAFNMKPTEVLGKKCYELIHGTKEPPSFCPHKQTLDTGKAGYTEVFEPHLGIYLEVSTSPICDNKGRTIATVHISKDITDRHQAREKLENAKREAEIANQAKSQFLANMSHDIRTPMNAIIGFSELLYGSNLTEEQRHYLSIIKECGTNLVHLIDELLDLSKIESNKLSVEMTDYSLGRLLALIESPLRPRAKEKQLAFDVVLCGDLPAKIHTDPNRLQQCLVNLVANAIKFTEQGHVYVRVSLQKFNDKTYICFDVEDTGIGIPAEKQELIFEEFLQLDQNETLKTGGIGLGLAITKKLVVLLNGKISVTSEVGKGSVFSLMIPVGLDVKSQQLLGADSFSHSFEQVSSAIEPYQFKGTVLVAEDSPHNQLLIKTLLEKVGLEVTLVENGKDAIEKAVNRQFDLILMDIQMPVVNGYEATRILREKGVTTPVIAITAYAMEGDEKKCISVGCNEYLPKPIQSKELFETIQKYLAAKPKHVSNTKY